MNVGSPFLAGPEVVHFYSYVTGVSFELPAGFTTDGESDSSASYIEAGGEQPARVQVRVVGQVDESTDPATADHISSRLADGFAQSEGAVLSRADRSVDGVPAHTVVSRKPDGSVLHQTVLSVDGRVIVVVAMVPESRSAELVPEFDQAVDSIRLVAL